MFSDNPIIRTLIEWINFIWIAIPIRIRPTMLELLFGAMICKKVLPPVKNGPTIADRWTHVKVAGLGDSEMIAPVLSPDPARFCFFTQKLKLSHLTLSTKLIRR